MQQVAILSRQQKDEAVNKTKKLTKEFGQRKLTAVQALAQRGVVRGGEKTAAKTQGRLHAVAQAIACSKALPLAGVAPAFERTIRRRSSRDPKATRMREKPQEREIGEGFALEHASQISLYMRGPRKTGVPANEPQPCPIRAQSPERAFAGVEPILNGRSSGPAPAIRRQVITGIVEIVGGRHHHNRYTTTQPFHRDCKLPVSERARAHALHVIEPEHVAQEPFGEPDGGGVRRGFACRALDEQCLADAEVARDLFA
jgi:hypothetical protein